MTHHLYHTGTIGFVACYLFVRMIYGAVKIGMRVEWGVVVEWGRMIVWPQHHTHQRRRPPPQTEKWGCRCTHACQYKTTLLEVIIHNPHIHTTPLPTNNTSTNNRAIREHTANHELHRNCTRWHQVSRNHSLVQPPMHTARYSMMYRQAPQAKIATQQAISQHAHRLGPTPRARRAKAVAPPRSTPPLDTIQPVRTLSRSNTVRMTVPEQQQMMQSLRSSPHTQLLWSPHDSEIWRLSGPAAVATLLEPLQALVDTACVGQLGTEPLAAVGLGTLVLTFGVSFFTTLQVVTTTTIAGHTARNDHSQVRGGATGKVLCRSPQTNLHKLMLNHRHPRQLAKHSH